MIRDPLVAGADGLGRVDEEGDDVDVGQRLKGRFVELLAQRVLGFVDTRRVHDDHLHVTGVVDSPEAMARGLRRTRGDGELLPHDVVEQRRLAGIGPADERHEATAKGIGVDRLAGTVADTGRLEHLVQI